MKIEKIYRKDLKAYRWGFDVTIMGQRIRRYEWPLKREAKDALAALQTRARAHRYGLIIPDPVITLDNLESKLSEDKSVSKQTLSIFKDFLEAIDRLKSLKDLTRADWKAYLTQLEGRKLKPGSINRNLAAVSGALHAAGEYFPALNEWRPPGAPWMPEPPGRDRLLSKEEIASLLAALRSGRQFRERPGGVENRYEVYDLFRLMMLTGAREGEILQLTQRQVSWDWRTVNVIATKTTTTRIIPLSEAALQILRARSSHAPRFFKKMKYHSLREALIRAADTAKIAYGDRVEGGWVLYDLRHVAATVMENAGVPYSAVAAILGHKRRDQTATYAHAQLDTLRRGVEALEKHCREIDGFFLHPGNMGTLPSTVRHLANG